MFQHFSGGEYKVITILQIAIFKLIEKLLIRKEDRVANGVVAVPAEKWPEEVDTKVEKIKKQERTGRYKDHN